ncbi:MAG: histidine ammonia-lyase [Elusimicrobiales bacterium]|jgi:histidine ammonia-lyase
MKNTAFALGDSPTIDEFALVSEGALKVVFTPAARARVTRARTELGALLKEDRTMYGINTGFGQLATERISGANLKQLQVNLIRSHACGVGVPLTGAQARGLMFARANELARAHSGVRPLVVEKLAEFLNKGLIPHIPSKGSVGASGDLAPSAHMSLCLIGEGKARIAGSKKFKDWAPAAQVLKALKIAPVELAEKEGLALINGTQAMQAVGGLAIYNALKLYSAAVLTAAVSVEALKGTPAAFDERIHLLKPHRGQVEAAATLRDLLKGSEIRASHAASDKRVQDPYSLRCLPQVMGAVRDAVEYSLNTVETEFSSVTDNPVLVDAKKGKGIEVLSGGNFHGQALAFAFDFAAVAVTAMGNMSERRIAQLVSDFVILPPFLARNPGLESGFMIAHVTAAALANENKVLSHPASADSIPTSANKEDFVSMGMNAALKLDTIVRNAAYITAIELLAAAQGVELHRPLKSGPRIEDALARLRRIAPVFKGDEEFSTRIEAVARAILDGYFLV